MTSSQSCGSCCCCCCFFNVWQQSRWSRLSFHTATYNGKCGVVTSVQGKEFNNDTRNWTSPHHTLPYHPQQVKFSNVDVSQDTKLFLLLSYLIAILCFRANSLMSNSTKPFQVCDGQEVLMGGLYWYMSLYLQYSEAGVISIRLITWCLVEEAVLPIDIRRDASELLVECQESGDLGICNLIIFVSLAVVCIYDYYYRRWC